MREASRDLADGDFAPDTVHQKRAKMPAYAVHTRKDLKRYGRFRRLYGELKYQRPVVRMRWNVSKLRYLHVIGEAANTQLS